MYIRSASHQVSIEVITMITSTVVKITKNIEAHHYSEENTSYVKIADTKYKIMGFGLYRSVQLLTWLLSSSGTVQQVQQHQIMRINKNTDRLI